MLDAFLIRTSAVFVAIPLKHNIYDENSDDTTEIIGEFLRYFSSTKVVVITHASSFFQS